MGGPGNPDPVGPEGNPQVPLVTLMEGPIPNPFNPQTVLKYSVAKAGDVGMSVFDIRGMLVKRLVHSFHETGPYEVVWKGRDSGGRRVSGGVYFVRFEAGQVVMNQRLVMVK